jgi:hypothetical protein
MPGPQDASAPRGIAHPDVAIPERRELPRRPTDEVPVPVAPAEAPVVEVPETPDVEQVETPEDDVPRLAVDDPEPVAPPKSTTVATLVAGTFEVRSTGAEGLVRAEPGFALRPGDVVRPAGKEPVEIALADRVNVVVDVGSHVVVAPDPERPYDVRLQSGQLFADVVKGTPFRVLTAHGDVESLGTKFAVSLEGVGEGQTELAVSVEEGIVRVERDRRRERERTGPPLMVNGGESIRVRRGFGPRRCGPEECRRHMGWVHRFRARCRRHGFGPHAGRMPGCPRGEGRGPAADGSHGGPGRSGMGPRGDDPERRRGPEGPKRRPRGRGGARGGSGGGRGARNGRR